MAGEIQEIKLADVEVSELNTRKNLSAGTEESSLDDLAKSIKKDGVLNPVLVREKGGKYELIVGQRRFLACQKIGKDTIPAEIRTDLSDADAKSLSLIENVMRADMDPLDKAEALNELYQEYGSYKKVSEKTGISSPTVSKYVSLLDLPDDLGEELDTSEGSAGVTSMSKLAKTFDDPDEMKDAYSEVKGFKSKTQKKIISKSEGDIGAIPDLVERAHEGEFDVRMCHGLKECPYIPEETIQEVIELVEENQQG